MRTHRTRRLLLMFCAIVPLSCKDSTGPVDDFAVYPLPRSIALVNSSDAALFTFAIDERHAAGLDLYPCIEDQCGLVAPNSTRHLQADDIYSGRVGSVVRVYYWRVAMGPNDEAVPGPLSFRRVQVEPGMLR